MYEKSFYTSDILIPSLWTTSWNDIFKNRSLVQQEHNKSEEDSDKSPPLVTHEDYFKLANQILEKATYDVPLYKRRLLFQVSVFLNYII